MKRDLSNFHVESLGRYQYKCNTVKVSIILTADQTNIKPNVITEDSFSTTIN